MFTDVLDVFLESVLLCLNDCTICYFLNYFAYIYGNHINLPLKVIAFAFNVSIFMFLPPTHVPDSPLCSKK